MRAARYERGPGARGAAGRPDPARGRVRRARPALERLPAVAVGVLLSAPVLHRLPTGAMSFPVVLVCGCAGMYLLDQGGSPDQQVLITALVICTTPAPGSPPARTRTAPGCACAGSGPPPWPRSAGSRRTPVPPPTSSPWRHRPHELSATLERRTGRTLLLPPRRPPAGAADTVRPRPLPAARTAPAPLLLTRELETRAAGRERAPGAPAGPEEAVRTVAAPADATAVALDAVLRAGLHLTHEAPADDAGASAR
ncbi:hypothetical protein ACFWUZ_13165 [Streptomyces sp. NPDC058646]|uniref:hypothetical protein n=1 Tax=Streptomyces sp. NPDC058646 TaxID=3346574 RepID=UPI00365DCBA3